MARKGRRSSKKPTASTPKAQSRHASVAATTILETTEAGAIMVAFTEQELHTLILTCDAGLESMESYVLENDGSPEATVAANDYGVLASARNSLKVAYINSLRNRNA